MMHAWKIPEVSSLVLGNPFLGKDAGRAQAQYAHYLKRLREKKFWLKCFSGKYRLSSYFPASKKQKIESNASENRPSQKSDESQDSKHFREKMLEGLQNFEGNIFFIISGKSLESQQFRLFVKNTKPWATVVNKAGNRIELLPEADQGFSTSQARADVIKLISNWLKGISNYSPIRAE